MILGQMTNSYLRSADVRTWPAASDARQALREYVDDLKRLPWSEVKGMDGADLDFRGADLAGFDLHEALFMESQLNDVRLCGADLASAWLIGTVLRGANLSGCQLHKAVCRAADAQGASFRMANLDRTQFEDADLRNTDLSGAVFGRANFFGIDLRGANLTGCSFGPKLWTSLSDCRVAGTQVTGAHGRFDGPCDISDDDTPHLIDGDELQEWFNSRGAQVEVVVT